MSEKERTSPIVWLAVAVGAIYLLVLVWRS